MFQKIFFSSVNKILVTIEKVGSEWIIDEMLEKIYALNLFYDGT